MTLIGQSIRSIVAPLQLREKNEFLNKTFEDDCVSHICSAHMKLGLMMTPQGATLILNQSCDLQSADAQGS